MSIKGVFPTIPRNSTARQQHSQYPKMWLDSNGQTIRVWSANDDLLNGVSAINYVFAAITVPAGNRAIVTRVSYDLTYFGQCYPSITDRVFLRNGMRETSRWDYDRFTNNILVPAYGLDVNKRVGSYPNPDTVEVYDFGNSGDTLLYGVRAWDGVNQILVDPRSFVEIDYLLVPPNSESYTNAQDFEGVQNGR